MPQVMIDFSIDRIAMLINSMSQQELETLFLLLTEDGKELLERKKDLALNRVNFLTRDEVFDDI